MAGGDFGVAVRPDVASYNTLISCVDPLDALNLIREMRLTRRNRDGVVLPNSVTYANAITRCRRAILDGDDDPDTAFEIASTLLDMAREEDDGGRGACLNVYVYSAAIRRRTAAAVAASAAGEGTSRRRLAIASLFTTPAPSDYSALDLPPCHGPPRTPRYPRSHSRLEEDLRPVEEAEAVSSLDENKNCNYFNEWYINNRSSRSPIGTTPASDIIDLVLSLSMCPL